MPSEDAIANPAAEHFDATAQVPIGNQEFLRSLAVALLALGISALLLVGSYVTLSPRLAQLEAGATPQDTRPWTFRGADLVARMGQGEETHRKSTICRCTGRVTSQL